MAEPYDLRMLLAEVWRHPVKSMQGEPLDAASVAASGVVDDRLWAVRDVETGKILTARRTPDLLYAAARLEADGLPVITLPDGGELDGPGSDTDTALSEWLGQAVSLVRASETDGRTIELYKDATDDTSPIWEWTMPTETFVDYYPLLVVTTATLRQGAQHHPDGAWVPRRFRPNLVIDIDGTGWVEDGWRGLEVSVGEVVIAVQKPCNRCSIVTRAQPGIAADTSIFKTLSKTHRTNLGMWASVVRPGIARVGDAVVVRGE